jgi:hypothetical protein
MAFPSHLRLIGVVSGMIVWAIWFAGVYALAGVGCSEGWNRRAAPGGNLLSLLMLLSAVLALALIAVCARSGYVGWRRGAEAPEPGRESQQRERFTGMLMFVISMLAALGTLLTSIPILMLDPCAA